MFNKICKDIKEVKIQGATNIAKAGVKALNYKRDKASIKKLLSLRPTEPCLKNAINHALKHGTKAALNYLTKSEKAITLYGKHLLPSNSRIFTHCHSSSVIKILKTKKGLTVYNTETRPLFQGRITSRELSKNKIKNIHFIDSAMRLAIKECHFILLGADAITKHKIYNKIGSELVAETAHLHKKPLYICSHSWKYSSTEPKLENRPTNEVWKNPPKHTKILNPAFEKINPKLITGIISELGILTHKQFIKKLK